MSSRTCRDISNRAQTHGFKYLLIVLLLSVPHAIFFPQTCSLSFHPPFSFFPTNSHTLISNFSFIQQKNPPQVTKPYTTNLLPPSSVTTNPSHQAYSFRTNSPPRRFGISGPGACLYFGGRGAENGTVMVSGKKFEIETRSPGGEV